MFRALKSTYERHGTLNLFAALRVASGYVYGKSTEQKKRQDFQQFLDGVIAELPPDQRNQEWQAKYDGRVHFHFTPASASWLNQVEIFFSIFERRTLRGRVSRVRINCEWRSKRTWLGTTNPPPFRWRKREVKGSQLRNTIVNLCN